MANIFWRATVRRWPATRKQIVYLADHELAVLTADSLRVIHRDQGQVQHQVRKL